LTCRFLVQEGVVDRERFTPISRPLWKKMAPGIEDSALVQLRQLIQAVPHAGHAQGVQ